MRPTNRMGNRPVMQRMAARRNAGPKPTTSTPVQSQPEPELLTISAGPMAPNPMPSYKKGGKVKGYKNGGCVMGKRGVRNTKML